ncbi:MAG: IS21 family transposase [Sulfuricurvum sp.]|jgi:transposase|uniref:IS21 family transposase n=1 Tax=Sulfuricurvum sp. TaxID=2025608 RepID=UPI0025E1D874|nr:IS21 family transposase [Sulfuricurvum sp.]MCI4407398.1 IS21 family transposase [Sulfuricurvum sp.]
MEDWVTIRNIKTKNPSIGTRAIANMLGISRNTVKKALASDEMPLYNRGEKKVNEHIIPHIDFIKESFLKKSLKASRILKDIQLRGYGGSQYALYAYIREFLKPISNDVNSKSPDAFMRYETAPAEQMQYDWSEYVVEIGGLSVKIYVHLAILGYSRYKCYDVSLSITQSDVLTALEESFSFFGGVCERLQVDNATVFVTKASKENLVWNQKFLHFCGFYGIKPTRSLPAHPWSKGKVESPFAYLETHFISGNTFENFEELRRRLKAFGNEHNLLLHGSTKQITKILFEQEEQSLLRALPYDNRTGEVKHYIGFKEEFRKVTSDCLISYKSNRYSVPYYFTGKEVWIRIVYGTTLQIYSSQNKLIASHALCLGKGEVIINPEHFKGYRTDAYDTLTMSVSRLTKRFANYSNIHHFIENIKVQKRIHPARHLYKIANLFEYYDDKECVIAMEECFTLNTYSFAIIKGTITHQSKPKKEQLNLFNITLPTGNIKRDLGDYQL